VFWIDKVTARDLEFSQRVESGRPPGEKALLKASETEEGTKARGGLKPPLHSGGEPKSGPGEPGPYKGRRDGRGRERKGKTGKNPTCKTGTWGTRRKRRLGVAWEETDYVVVHDVHE
jgi:hypothetical protein